MRRSLPFVTLALALAPVFAGTAWSQEDYVFEGTIDLRNTMNNALSMSRLERGIVACNVCSTAPCSISATGSVVAEGSTDFFITGGDVNLPFRVIAMRRSGADPATARSYVCWITVFGSHAVAASSAGNDAFRSTEFTSQPFERAVPGPDSPYLAARTQGAPVVELRGEVKRR